MVCCICQNRRISSNTVITREEYFDVLDLTRVGAKKNRSVDTHGNVATRIE